MQFFQHLRNTTQKQGVIKMDWFDEFLLWTSVLLEILGGDLAGGFYGWYFATRMFGLEHAQTGIWIGALIGCAFAVFWSLYYGELSEEEKE